MLSKHIEAQERLEVLRNDQRVREQGTTFSQFAASEAQEDRGRFTAHSSATVIGSAPTPATAYPAAYLQHDPVPDEPALGVSVNAMEPTGEPHELKASLAELSAGSGCLQSSQTPTPPASAAPQSLPPLAAERGAGGFSSRTYRRA